MAAEAFSLPRAASRQTQPLDTGAAAAADVVDRGCAEPRAGSPVPSRPSSLDTSGISHGEDGPCRRIVLMNRSTRRYLGVRCGSYRCQKCAPVNRKRFLRRVHLGLGQAGGHEPPARFLTLTCPPNEDLRLSWDQLTRRFQKLRQRVGVRYGGQFEYAGVVEATRRGVPHLHVIFRGPWVRQAEWSAMAEASGFGPVVWISRVTSSAVAGYAAKGLGGYLSKGFAHEYPRHFRRVRFSQDWAPEWVSGPRRGPQEGAREAWVRIAPSDPEWAAYMAWRWIEAGAVSAAILAGQGRSENGGAAADP